MSMQIRFLKNPKGILAVDAEPGETRWVPRALANQLITRGFAEGYAPTEHRGETEVATVAPDEKAVVGPGKPRKRGRQKREVEPEPPVEPKEGPEEKTASEPGTPTNPPVEPEPTAGPPSSSDDKTVSDPGSPGEPPVKSDDENKDPADEKTGVPEEPPGLSGIPSVDDVFGKE